MARGEDTSRHKNRQVGQDWIEGFISRTAQPTAWIEDSPTHSTEGYIYGQHSSKEANHLMRMVYGDGTPVRGSAGHWRDCKDCQ